MARPRLVSDEDILGAVRHGVLRQGPGVSLEVVADRLGISAPALFKRFGSRKALLMAALKPPERPPFFDALEKGPDTRPFEKQLSALVESILGFLQENYPCMSALRESGLTAADLKKLYREPPGIRAARALEGWLERAHAAGLARIENAKVTAMAILGACHMPVMMSHMARVHAGAHSLAASDLGPFAQRIAELFCHGLHPRKRTS